MTAPRPARDLDQALAAMTWRVEPGTFALAGFPGPPGPADLADLAALSPPAQMALEAEATTLLVGEEALAGVLERHPGARVERPLRWVRFEAPMGWEVVGFLARITSALAAAGIPLGAVCAYSRDHLFVAETHRAATERVLGEVLGGRD